MIGVAYESIPLRRGACVTSSRAFGWMRSSKSTSGTSTPRDARPRRA